MTGTPVVWHDSGRATESAPAGATSSSTPLLITPSGISATADSSATSFLRIPTTPPEAPRPGKPTSRGPKYLGRPAVSRPLTALRHHDTTERAAHLSPG